MCRKLVPLACIAAFALVPIAVEAESPTEPVKPLLHAHAHNDYLHERPLLDALEHGFTSVEADVFLVDGQLLVAHEEKALRPDRTLSGLYLDPLRKRARGNGGWLLDRGLAVTLFIDVKSDAEKTYVALDRLLAGYEDMLTTVDDGKLETRAVSVVVSGNRAIETISTQKKRYAAIDGRFSDLDSTQPAHLLALISDNWRNHFQWSGDGPFPDEQREKLQKIVKKAHEHGRRVRLWATPESPAVWKELLAAGADLINTDDLQRLEDYLRKTVKE